MSSARSIAVVLSLASLFAGGPAKALTRVERRCELAVSRGGATVFVGLLDALAKCRARIAQGNLPVGTDCSTEATVASKRAALARKVTQRIGKACSEATAVALHFGGDCDGAATPAALATCARGSHEAGATDVIDITDPASVQPATGRRCQARASARVRRFVAARLRLLQKCKQDPPAGLTPGSSCQDDPRTAGRIAARATRTTSAIVSRCPNGAAGEAHFGAPCDASADGTALAECLLAAATSASDRVIMAEYPNRGFCGDSFEAIEDRIDGIVAGMTLDEKIAQMHGSGLAASGWRTADNARLGIPGFGMFDGPRGVSGLAGHATAFPVGIARGATWDPDLEERVGEAIGSEARAKGASVLLAPTINIVRHPRGGRTQESYGEDTFHLGKMTVGFVKGVQQHVLASAKHFAANSIENTRLNVDVTVDERSLREVYLPHFRMAVEEGHVASVMSAYNLVNGLYCAENPHLLSDVLKHDWGFTGFVESDWILGTRSTAPSANAGLDIEMPSGTFFGSPLATAVAAGDVSEETLNQAVRRILRAKLCFRLDTEPPVVDPSMVETPAHLALAREVAQKAIVLLKNADGTLPLERASLGSIVVAGSLAAIANLGDRGSSSVNPTSRVAPLDGIQAAAGAATVTHVAAPFSPEEEAAVTAADVAIVVVGLTTDDEGEGQITFGDRASLVLPGDQNALISAVAALNPRTVVVLELSGPVTMPWLNDVAAVVMAWYPGEEGGNAIADVLFGDVNPSGKLPLSFPQAEADLPPFDNTSNAVTYDYLHGYRWLDQQGTQALFPFGFGLSYTTFHYANLTVAPAALQPGGRLVVTADVSNTGALAGDEIAELYVSATGSRVERAPKDLKAFARVHLEAGQTRTVRFEVRAADLAFWDVVAGDWEVEPISYVVRVGPSSADLPLEATVAVMP
jgi:beta-glucosidase